MSVLRIVASHQSPSSILSSGPSRSPFDWIGRTISASLCLDVPLAQYLGGRSIFYSHTPLTSSLLLRGVFRCIGDAFPAPHLGKNHHRFFQVQRLRREDWSVACSFLARSIFPLPPAMVRCRW